MAMSSSPALQKLRFPDTSLPDFHNQLSRILSGSEYAQRKTGLKPNDLKWLVDYLDEVRRRFVLSDF